MQVINGIATFESTPEEKELNAKLEKLRADNWQALRGMLRSDLAELADDIERIPHMGLWGDEVSVLRSEAVQAIRNECKKRDELRGGRVQEQQKRRTDIERAASLAESAAECLSAAFLTERESPNIPAPIEQPDVSVMSDDELISLIGKCRTESASLDNWHSHILQVAENLGFLKLANARKAVNELTADATKLAETIASMHDAADAAESELMQRRTERERIESERAEIEENLPDIVAKLRVEIDELRSQLVQ